MTKQEILKEIEKSEEHMEEIRNRCIEWNKKVGYPAVTCHPDYDAERDYIIYLKGLLSKMD